MFDNRGIFNQKKASCLYLSLFIYEWIHINTGVKMYKLYGYKEKFLMTVKFFPASFGHGGHFKGIFYEYRNYISLVSFWNHIKKCSYISSVFLNIGKHPESQLNLWRVNGKRETFLTWPKWLKVKGRGKQLLSVSFDI